MFGVEILQMSQNTVLRLDIPLFFKFNNFFFFFCSFLCLRIRWMVEDWASEICGIILFLLTKRSTSMNYSAPKGWRMSCGCKRQSRRARDRTSWHNCGRNRVVDLNWRIWLIGIFARRNRCWSCSWWCNSTGVWRLNGCWWSVGRLYSASLRDSRCEDWNTSSSSLSHFDGD